MGSAPAEGTPTLELRDVSKAFGQVVALRSGSLTLYPGSIHALVGENGAGKSTLVKIMAGLYQRDAGTFEMEGEPVDFKTTAEAKAAGIAVIYQEPTLFPDLSVTENVFMGRQPVGRFRRIDRKAMRTEVRGLMERLGVRIDADRPARYLSTSKAKGKVALTGLGTPNQIREYVKDGTVKEFALWNPHDLGYLAAYATKSLITGEIKGGEGDKFTAGKLGEYTVGANKTVVLGDPFKFNKDNIDQFKF